MSIFGNYPTFEEAINNLEQDMGLPRYTAYIDEILSFGTDDQTGLFESEFVDQFVNPPKNLDAETERSIEFIPRSLRVSFSLIDWLTELERPSESQLISPILTSVHLELFRRQYLVGEKLRRLFSSLVEESGHDDEDEYLDELRSKYGLSEAETQVLKFEWVDIYYQVLQGIIEDDLHIMAFQSDPVCFQVRNRKKQIALSAPGIFKTENDIIITKYFFLSGAIEHLSLLELLTKIIASENSYDYSKANIGFDELYQIDSIFVTGRKLSEIIQESLEN